MKSEIEQLNAEISSFIIESKEHLEEFQRLYTSRKGRIAALFDRMKEVPKEEKALVGKLLNELKQNAQAKSDYAETIFIQVSDVNKPNDLTLPGSFWKSGGRHPLMNVMYQVSEIFRRIGFVIEEGPEIEDDWHNFSALNFEEGHPAREMQDTFFISKNPDRVLRTHTTSVQARVLENSKPPIRILAPGRVYRNEAISARAHCFFHQVDGFYVDEGVSFAELKTTLNHFVRTMFGADTKTRLRPSYFPFTEISAEMDLSCLICKGEGCAVCKHSGWVEILGCGMIDPNVLKNCKIDADRYSGFAFGMGVERVAQLLYRVPDLRLYSQNDIRFLQQFKQIN